MGLGIVAVSGFTKHTLVDVRVPSALTVDTVDAPSAAPVSSYPGLMPSSLLASMRTGAG